jgi:membrane-associated phospholipid phosphatase
MIAVCLGVGCSPARKATLAGFAIAGVVIVAVLALYSYAHTFTDVMGGMALGAGIVAAGAAAISGSRPAPAAVRR